MQRGEIRTPAFMPVGTAATVKAMKPEAVRATGADIILGNTYHLMLRPGAERVARLGGLHRFMNWDRPILTDSGGYQVMSLSELRKITEEGVTFASHLDGSQHLLTPERSMEIQRLLGSDIVMAFDECPRADQPREVIAALDGTVDALGEAQPRCLRCGRRACGERGAVRHPAGRARRGPAPAERRGADRDRLRRLCDRRAGGGRGAGGDVRHARLRARPAAGERPRYLMGVGKPDDLVGAVERGVDMFDCVLPTRSGRNGQAFTWTGPLNLRNARHAEDTGPLDERCACATAARSYSRAYLHHLIKSGEILGAMLLTEHNLSFYQQLMQAMRDGDRGRALRGLCRNVPQRLSPARWLNSNAATSNR